jgi:hypothetical protein
MIIGFRTPDKLLYHYTKLEIAHDHIIKNRTLKLGRFTSTNDPKEIKDWEFSLYTANQGGLLNFDSLAVSKRLSAALKARTKLGCFCRDSQPLSGDHTKDIFFRGWSKPRMWAQYAENHTGVCLVFDRQALDEAVVKLAGFDAIVYRANVSYANQGIVPVFGPDAYTINCDTLSTLQFDGYVREHLRTFVRRLFFEKMSDWRDEQEFRWVVFSDREKDLFVEINSSLKAIMFGDRCPEEAVDALIENTEAMGLEYMGLKWRNCSPWYDFGSFRYSKDFRDFQKANQTKSNTRPHSKETWNQTNR